MTKRSFLPTLAAAVALTAFAAVPTTQAVARGGGGGGGQVAPSLPADFPSRFPMPAGTLFGSTGSSPHWVVQLTVAGLHQQALDNAIPTFVARGYRVLAHSPVPNATGNATLTNGTLTVGLFTSDIDHGPGANTSALAIQVDLKV